MPQIVPGQRWISSAEPELGIGRIAQIQQRDVVILFDQASEQRVYRLNNAPLLRYTISIGDQAQTTSGEITVTGIEEREGLLYYTHQEGELCETDLRGAIVSANKGVAEGLFEGEFDSVEAFELRSAANELRHRVESSPVRGLVGARIDLFPHQLYIAERACSEGRLPRRLLSDEVGLGKTIEAGLIYHRLKRTRRIKRTLIITPEALRFQWFTEMHRRFHSTFTIVDDDFCASLDIGDSDDDNQLAFIGEKRAAQPAPNPFLAQDDILVGMDWIFATHEQDLQEGLRGQKKMEELITKRIGWLLAARFDLVIVDEAHTIDPDNEYFSRNYGALDLARMLSGEALYNPKLDAHLGPELKESSPEYKLLHQIARRTPGLLLLTATPVQLHPKAHFARLHLLDPVRYPDYAEWLKDREQYEELADHLGALIDRIVSPDEPWEAFRSALNKQTEQTPLHKIANAIPDAERLTTGEAISFLCDTIGTGRVMIRNTRKSVGGFSQRKLLAYPIEPDHNYRHDLLQIIDEEYDGQSDCFRLNQSLSLDEELFLEKEKAQLLELWKRDEKAIWLSQLLSRELSGKKVLVLCSTRATAQALQRALGELIGLECELFHEQMEMVERDRAAAHFSEPEGVSLLIASEIGSEGRNFQFAHDLVMYDLPIAPGLLEQRIGRLDRIGQNETVSIHVPYVIETTQHRLFEWYNDALDAFVRPLMGIELIHNEFEEELRTHLDQPEIDPQYFHTTFAQKAQLTADRLRDEMEKGRDRLLEFNSYSPKEAAAIVQLMQEEDEENPAEALVLEALEHFGAEVEHGHLPGTWVATPGELMPDYPGLSLEGMTVTSDRALALLHEEIDLFTIDHPLVQGTLDLLLNGETGRRSFALARRGLPPGLYFEFHYTMECITPPDWNLREVLHPMHFSTLIDRSGASKTELLDLLPTLLLEDGSAATLEQFEEELLPKMTELEHRATEQVQKQAKEALLLMIKRAVHLIDQEIRRLRKLQQGNYPGISKRIEQMEQRKEEVTRMFQRPALQLDALRIIWSRGSTSR